MTTGMGSSTPKRISVLGGVAVAVLGFDASAAQVESPAVPAYTQSRFDPRLGTSYHLAATTADFPAPALNARGASVQSEPSKFAWHELAPGVYAVEASSMGSNSLVVIGDSSVLLVDSQIAPASASQLLEEIGQITGRPLRYVVNTHWHVDHSGGNEALRRVSPDVSLIAHADAVGEAAEKGDAQRQRALAFWQETLGENPSPVDRQSLAEMRRPYVFYVDTLIDEPLDLDLGGRTATVLPTPGGHTEGDLIVYLPAEGIIAAGDLVLPQLFASNGFPGRVLQSLRQLVDLEATIVVPGHGPVLEGTDHIQRQVGQLETLRNDVLDAMEDGEDPESIVSRFAPSAGELLGDPEGLIRAIMREVAASLAK